MTEFDNACLAAAEAFLQTVVLLDDQAAFGKADETIPDDLVEPDEGDLSPARSGEDGQATLARFKAEGLDAGVITSGFAARGFVCAVLHPDQGGSQAVTLKAAERADVVVLDWEMGDDGTKATEIINRLHSKDHGHGDRLRLVVIYTGANPLRKVADRVKKTVTGFDTPTGVPKTDLVFENAGGTTRLIILAKTGVHNAPEEKRYAVSEVALPERIITEFAKFAGGLLPNATLASIAALRSHTHRVLSRLDKRLDGPLLTHRTLVDSADAEQFVATLIMEELQSQVPLAGISRTFFGEKSIRAYFENRKRNRLKSEFIDFGGSRRQMTVEETCALIEHGVTALSDSTIGFKDVSKDSRADIDASSERNLHKKLYHLTEDKKPVSERAHERLAVISGMARNGAVDAEQGPGEAPILKLGTVLLCEGRYWVCVTPLCDCVRLPPDGGRFLLVELLVVKGDRDWSVIVEVDGVHVKLLIQKKRPNLATVWFGPSTGGLIKAEIRDKEGPPPETPVAGVGRVRAPDEVAVEIVPPTDAGVATTIQVRTTHEVVPTVGEGVAATVKDDEATTDEAGVTCGVDAPKTPMSEEKSETEPKPKVAVFHEVSTSGEWTKATYRWLGEMKAMQAQRVVQNFASNVARVGLDEFDWQRRQAPPA